VKTSCSPCVVSTRLPLNNLANTAEASLQPLSKQE
jgi:hypothetical protein